MYSVILNFVELWRILPQGFLTCFISLNNSSCSRKAFTTARTLFAK